MTFDRPIAEVRGFAREALAVGRLVGENVVSENVVSAWRQWGVERCTTRRGSSLGRGIFAPHPTSELTETTEMRT